MATKQCWTLKPFLKPQWYIEKKLSKNLTFAVKYFEKPSMKIIFKQRRDSDLPGKKCHPYTQTLLG